MATNFNMSRILIVDDQEANVYLLERLLNQKGYPFTKTVTDSRLVLTNYQAFKPDLILLDLHMHFMDGYAVMDQLRPFMQEETFLPILVLTADLTQKAREKALLAGARDFVCKPFDRTELMLRINNLLETRYIYQQLKHHQGELEKKVKDRTRDVLDTQLEVIKRLARAAEFRDDATGHHALRVGRTSALLARALGFDQEYIDLILHAAPLHDIGKIGIPDSILLSPNRLTPEERLQMQEHTHLGARLLEGGRFPLLQLASEIALSHHERWDGTGYPEGRQGEDIPMEARICAVADVFDALTHKRAYKEAWAVRIAALEIERQSGRQFDPNVAAAFSIVSNTHDLMNLDPEGAEEEMQGRRDDQRTIDAMARANIGEAWIT